MKAKRISQKAVNGNRIGNFDTGKRTNLKQNDSERIEYLAYMPNLSVISGILEVLLRKNGNLNITIMERYDYLEAIKEDILNYINENGLTPYKRKNLLETAKSLIECIELDIILR